MPTLTTVDLVKEIEKLDKRSTYPYVGGRSAFRIKEVIKPEGGVISLCARMDETTSVSSLM
jgi:hypothetical protein